MNYTASITEPALAARRVQTHELLIDGRRVAPASGQYFDTLDPATEQPIARVAAGDAADIDAAVRSARTAFEGPWKRLRANERGALLLRFADRIREHADELVALESLDSGKPVSAIRRMPARRGSCHA